MNTDNAENASPIGWQQDGRYVPCPDCGRPPSPETNPKAPGTPIPLVPNRPGVVVHDSDCPKVSLSPEARARLSARLREYDNARRRAWEGAHDHVIG